MAATYRLLCPACDQPFLATHTRMATVTTCPHCAFNAPLQQFAESGTPSLGTAASLPMKRRVLRPPQADGSSPPPAPPAPAPTALPVLPAMPEAAPPPLSPPLHPPPSRPAIRERSTPVTLRPDAVPGQELLWPGLQTDRPIDPAMPQPDPPPHPGPRPLSGRRTFWWLLTLGLLVFTATGFLIWTHLQSPPATGPAPTTPLAEEIRRPSAEPVDLNAVENSTQPTFTIEQQVAIQKLSVEAPEVLRAWLTPGQSIDQRLEWVHRGEQYRDQIAAFFAREPTLLQVQRYPVFPSRLPEMQPVPLFQVATSTNEDGGLALFVEQPDGSVKLDWPLFHQTHERELGRYIAEEDPSSEPRWFHVGLRRSHGLELNQDLRGRLHAFDLQSSPTGTARATAYSGRDLPVGRFLNRVTDWSVVYLAELLMKIEILDDGDPALMILDCRGAGLATGDR